MVDNSLSFHGKDTERHIQTCKALVAAKWWQDFFMLYTDSRCMAVLMQVSIPIMPYIHLFLLSMYIPLSCHCLSWPPSLSPSLEPLAEPRPRP
jgi:hypothetical protein